MPRHLIFSANEAIWRMCDGGLQGLRSSLTRQLLNHISIQSLPLARLAALYPQEVAALAIAAPPKATVYVPPSWLRAVDDATCLALVRRSHSPLSPGEFSQPPPQYRAPALCRGANRAHAWQGRGAATSRGHGACRNGPQSRGCAGLVRPRVCRHPSPRLAYVVLLSFEEALAQAKPFASQPDPELRALANAQIITAARFEAKYLEDVLAYCLKKKNRTLCVLR